MASFESFFIRDPETGELIIPLTVPEPVYELLRDFCERFDYEPAQAIGMSIAILHGMPADPEAILTQLAPNRQN